MRFAVLLALGFSAASASFAAPPSPFKPGTVALAVPPGVESYLGIDLAHFTRALCDGGESKGGPTGRIDCGSSIEGSRMGDPIEGQVFDFVSDAELTVATFEPTDLVLSIPRAWTGPCGSFDLTVTLDPGVAQPQSKLTLIPDGKAPRGSFSGFFAAAVRLRFEAVGGGRVVEAPAELTVPLGGPYALVDLPSPAGKPARSNVQLLIRREDGTWARTLSCAAPPLPCPNVCLTASQKTLGGLKTAPVAGRPKDGSQ